MYDFNVNPTVEYYHQSISVNRNTHSQAMIDLGYFENYQAMSRIKVLSHFNNVKNKWQSYFENNESYLSAEYTQSEIKALIQSFEKKFDMSSDKFKESYATGEIPDAFEIVLWKSFLGLR